MLDMYGKLCDFTVSFSRSYNYTILLGTWAVAKYLLHVQTVFEKDSLNVLKCAA